MLDFSLLTYAGFLQSFSPLKLWLGDMAKNIMIKFFYQSILIIIMINVTSLFLSSLKTEVKVVETGQLIVVLSSEHDKHLPKR